MSVQWSVIYTEEGKGGGTSFIIGYGKDVRENKRQKGADVSVVGVRCHIACLFLCLNRHDIQENVHGPLTHHTCAIFALETMHGHLDPYPARFHSMMYCEGSLRVLTSLSTYEQSWLFSYW